MLKPSTLSAMRSKAHLSSHPIHPMLIAFSTGTLIFDILGVVNNNLGFWTMGMYLEAAGIITALIAAVPGIIDYIFTVPPKSSAKKRATWHGLINVTNVIVFLTALVNR